jgi:putative SOS response-associated peptidase YedK
VAGHGDSRGRGERATLLAEATLADLPALLRPARDDALMALAVGPFVNSARHEGPRCVEPLPGPSLFDRLPG